MFIYPADNPKKDEPNKKPQPDHVNDPTKSDPKYPPENDKKIYFYSVY